MANTKTVFHEKAGPSSVGPQAPGALVTIAAPPAAAGRAAAQSRGMALVAGDRNVFFLKPADLIGGRRPKR